MRTFLNEFLCLIRHADIFDQKVCLITRVDEPEVRSWCGHKWQKFFADISAKKGPFWIKPLTAYSRVLFCRRVASGDY